MKCVAGMLPKIERTCRGRKVRGESRVWQAWAVCEGEQQESSSIKGPRGQDRGGRIRRRDVQWREQG